MPERSPFGQRIAAGCIDYVAPFVATAVFDRIGNWAGALASLAAVAFVVASKVAEGRSGASFGKQLAGCRLVRAGTDEPVGVQVALVRVALHLFDALPLGLGFLLPLRDPEGRTLADRIAGTAVVTADDRVVVLP